MVIRLRSLFAIALAVSLAACAAPSREEAETAPLVWPPEPDAPRLAFVKSFSRPDDLGIAKGFFQRLRDFVFGGTESHLVRPMAIVESKGLLFVADPGARGVHRFDPAAADYDLIQAADGRPFPSPVGLARGANGEVYVADSKLAQVFVIRPGQKAATPLALQADLGQPTGIACDPASGRLYVVDTATHRIMLFDRDGRLTGSIGRRGTDDGEFNYPTLLWRSPQGRLYVTDSLNFRVQILDEDGKFVSKFGRAGDGTGDAARQKGVATDRYGHVYVVDALFHAVQVFDEAGRFLLSVGGQGQERGEFWLPTGIFIGEDDQIYVADSYNQRIQVLRYIGGPT